MLVLERVESGDDLTKREEFWISHYRSDKTKHGFNLKPANRSIKGAIFKPFGEKKLVRMVEKYRAEHGEFPKTTSTPMGRLSWRSIDSLLRQGKRGFPGGYGLSGFLNKYFQTIGTSGYTVESISRLMIAHHAQYGTYPTTSTSKKILVNGKEVNWKGIAGLLRSHQLSFHDILAKQTFYRQKLHYNSTLVSKWIARYMEEYGVRPLKTTGVIPWSIDDAGRSLTWAAVYHHLAKYEHITLPKLVDSVAALTSTR